MCLDSIKSKHGGTSTEERKRWKTVGENDTFIYASQPLVRGKWLKARKDEAEELSYIGIKYTPGFHVLTSREDGESYAHNHGGEVREVKVKGLLAKGKGDGLVVEVYKYIKFGGK